MNREGAAESCGPLAGFRLQHERLRESLRQARVALLVARYDGGDETGHIYEIAGFGDPRGEREARELGGYLLEAVRKHLHDVLEARCGAWELGDGACGEIRWSVAGDKAVHIHNARIVRYHQRAYSDWADLLGER